MNRIVQTLKKFAESSASRVKGIASCGVQGLEKAVTYAGENRRMLDPYVAVLLAIVPILQHYVGAIDNAATTVLILLAPYLVLRLIPTIPVFKVSNLRFAAVLIVFFLYKLVDHGTYFSEIAQVGLMCFYLVCLCQNVIDTRILKNAAIVIAAAAGIVLLLQYFCYYILGFHLQIVPDACLLAESHRWILGVQTGTVSVTGEVSRFYRPCAFFLEPSHLFLYGFPSLFITLFATPANRKTRFAAILISLGMILCTSGMGIAVTVGAWGLYFALKNSEDDSFRLCNIFRKCNLIMIGCLVAVCVLAILFVPFVRSSVVRIFYNPDGSTAIGGRTDRAMSALGKMKAAQWIFGVSDSTSELKFNMPGFMASMYKYGIIGVILSYWVYVKGLFKLNMPYFWYTVILLVVSFFSAHTHGTFFMLYYVLLLKEGHDVSKEAWILALKEPFVNLLKKVKNPKKPAASETETDE